MHFSYHTFTYILYESFTIFEQFYIYELVFYLQIVRSMWYISLVISSMLHVIRISFVYICDLHMGCQEFKFISGLCCPGFGSTGDSLRTRVWLIRFRTASSLVSLVFGALCLGYISQTHVCFIAVECVFLFNK